MTFPPLCDTCGHQHIHSCEDAAGTRALLAAMCDRLAAAVRPGTAIADVPPALRGPNWPGRNLDGQP